MKKAIQYNVTENVFVASQNKLHRTLTGSDRGEHSYLKDDGIVNNVARGIGGMLPAVVASIATFGAAAPAAVGGTAAASGTTAASTAAAAKAAQVASMATMATGAAGQASQEAYEDGAGFYGGQAYGLLRGATEAATEYALGGATKLITGGGMLPGVRKSVASVGIGRVAKAALEEGAEEGISELLDPATRTTYKGREALSEYRDPAFYRRVLQASRDGTLTGLAFQGTIGHAMGNTGRAADMQEISQELDTLAEKRRKLDANLRLTDEADAAIGEAERENWRVAETVLKKATPEKRAALIKDYGLADRFGEDGSMTADFAASLDRRATVGQAAADGENGAPADSAGRIDRRTASMDADAEKVSAALGREGRTQFTDVDSLSKAGRENLKKVKRVMNVLGELSGGEVGNFVIASESVEDNGYYDPGTGYVVLGADVLENGIDGTAKKGVQTWFGTILHETAHGTENTDAWAAMTAKLREIDGGRYYTETLKELGNRGYLNGKAADIRTEFEKILRKMEKGEKLTVKQEAFADTFISESGSIMAELALGNKHFARALLDADASVVEKILHRIEDAKEALARRKDPEAKKVFEEIRAAEGMFLEAVAESGFVYRDGKIVGATEEEDKVKKSLKGIAADGKKIYESNFPKGTPKAAKSERILDYIQNVWSKKPIPLVISNGETSRTIYAHFDPTIDETQNTPSDASKLAGGNRHGTHSEQRVTLDLADDYYDIASSATYNYSKLETGKDSQTHDGVIMWHYFVEDIYFSEYGSNETTPYTVTINVKEKTNGNYVYSFNAEKESSTRRTLHADVNTRKGANGELFLDDSIHDSEPIVNPSDEISPEKSSEPVKKSRKVNSQTSGKTADKTPETEHLTGMQKQTVAKYALTKVYTKAEALEIIEQAARMLDETYGFDGGLGEASGFVKLTKTVKDAAAVDLWKAYNSVNTEAEKLEIARKLADTLMAEAQLVTLASDEELAEAREVVDCLRRYFHKIDLSGIDGEIKVSGIDAKALRGRWSAKKGEQSFTADQLKAEIEGKLGLRIPADNEADIFFWMDEQYRKASEVIGNTNKALLFGNSNGERLAEDKAVRDQIAAEIVKSFKKGGQPSEWTKRLLYEVEPFYDKETDGQGITRAVFNAGKALNFARLNVRVTALSAGVKDWKAGTFLNQSQPQYQSIFKDTIGQLAKINRGGRLLDPVKCRELIGKLGEWYTEDNMKAMGVTFNEEIDGYIKQISEGEGGLTVSDMKAMESVIEYMKHTAETYQTVWRNGKRVKALPVAREYVRIMGENQKLRVGKIDHIFSSWYMRLYGDPHMLVRYMDKYKNGFYTEMFERMRDGAMKAQIYRKRLEDQIAETMEKYPKYFKELEGRKILIHGSDMPVGEAMSLWMSLNRDQAIAGILENGYCFTDDDPKKTFRRVFGFTGDEVIRDKEGNILPQYRQKIEELQAEIWEQLSDADKAYIQIAWKLLNQDCKTLKRDTDLARMGYSNAIEDFYFPIRRANSAQDVDQQTFYDEIGRVSNASFNKDTVKGAKNQLLIEPIQVVMERHMRGVTMYAALGTLIDDYKMLKNLNVDGEQNHNKPVSIATEEPNTWEEGRKYFEQLMADIQGIKPNSDEVTRFVGKLRGHYARAVLSANPKVIATQLSSLFAGMNIIDADCMKMMFSDRGRDVFTYSELAELRASENTAAMAQGLLDEAGDFLMKPIGATDAWVVRRLFVAAQYQVAKDQKLQVGTEENKKAAGKLLERVIFETQQNSLATEKSQAARSASEFQKMMTMFTSDAVKGAGQLLDAIGEITTIRNEAKVSGQPINKDRLRQARKRAGRAAASLGAVAVYSALLAVLIKKLLDRDDEWGWGDFLSEIGAGLLGGLPIVKEIYDGFFGAGYGVEDMSVEAVNDLMDSTKGGFDAMGSFVSGDLSGREAANATRKLIYAIGNVAGLPARNSYTWSRRLVGIFSPDAAYKMEDFFVAQSYRSDIAKAVASGDESRLETVIGVMLDTNVGEVTSSDVRQEMKRLVSGGMDVLPRGVGDTVTVDGETVKLTETQKRAFRAVYSEANKSVEKMVGLAYYADASDEAKAKAIKRVYGIYYNRAIEDLLGVELENRNTLLSRAVDPEVLAVVLAVCGEMQADVGKDGKPVANSKRKKVEEYVDSLKLRAAQKYIIMGALGYKNKLGKEKVEAYVRGLGLTTSEIEAMIGFSGY